jgi:hypothetical protein
MVTPPHHPSFSASASPPTAALWLIGLAGGQGTYPPTGISEHVRAVLQRPDAESVVIHICAFASVLSQIATEGSDLTPEDLLTQTGDIIRRNTAGQQ